MENYQAKIPFNTSSSNVNPRVASSPPRKNCASPSFSLLLFTPYLPHLIPSPPRACDIRSGRRGSSATNTGYRNACRTQHSYEFEDSLQHDLFECQLSSCFFNIRLWLGESRLTIPWQILNGSVRCGDHRVGRGSEAMRSRYSQGIACTNCSGCVKCGSPNRGRSSTARFGGVIVVVAGDPKQCVPVIPKSSSTQIVNFVDAPGGTGKTFLEETVLARIRSEGTVRRAPYYGPQALEIEIART
ncbi:BQ5605_C006g03998 [Microbotryum silenes-dioicae]|uniref:BQ5605_C006g03998 protein n=1 Tax=Microbotryum silenes-dioicae TaxID=796604 RepID=A0A2X0MSU3_9BASI|nr:BQ5605_C006g03998 [Microbotryum silenes-dioicae]